MMKTNSIMIMVVPGAENVCHKNVAILKSKSTWTNILYLSIVSQLNIEK